MSLNKQTNKINGVNILVCGSQHFDDPAAVFGILGAFHQQTGGNIRKIYTSKFSGCCEYARQWAEITNKFLEEDKKIEIVDYMFDTVLEKKNNFLYDELDMPPSAVENKDYFKEVKDKILAMGVNLVLPFPNKEGVLGVATKNISRAAEMAGVLQIDCTTGYNALKNRALDQETNAVEPPKEDNSLGFKNRHPNKH